MSFFVRVSVNLLRQILVGVAVVTSIWLVSGEGGLAQTDQRTFWVSEWRIVGSGKTQRSWLQQYLNLVLPGAFSVEDAAVIETKLLKTGVFLYVHVSFEALDDDEEAFELVIDLYEKWTTIPIVRGAFGGGTPLTVFGLYDTHSFGSLWTLGAELQRYGNAEPGYVIWARAPRWRQGYHNLGFEFWRARRIRTIYDQNEFEKASIETDAHLMRVFFASPLLVRRSGSSEGLWQAGVDLRWRDAMPTRVDWRGREDETGSESLLERIDLEHDEVVEFAILPTLIYDDINARYLTKQGLRWILHAGPIIGQRTTSAKVESEFFYYQMLPTEINLALHGLVGRSSDTAPHNLYFLGGFDSIRGFPDGIIYGQNAAYANIELRRQIGHWRYLWLQGVGFVDVGGAGSSWREAARQQRQSAGVGFRLAIPQVYRLMFRVDFAWSEGKTSGLSAGLNHFFQPYRPL